MKKIIKKSRRNRGGNWMLVHFIFIFLIMSNLLRGQIVFSEIMYHPASAEDNWEWVEIYNSGSSTVNLAGYVLDDNNGLAHDSANILSGIIHPGCTAILYNAEDLTDINFAAAWGPNINLVPTLNWSVGSLNNGGDQVSLWSSYASYSGDHITHTNAISLVNYDNSFPWPVDDGFGSIYLTDLSADATDGSNWALSSVGANTPTFEAYQSNALETNSGNDIGSPGPGLPSLNNLIISEIMYNPSSLEDNWEWVEIYNPGPSSVDLMGYVFDDNNGVAQDSANIADGIIAPGTTVILYNADLVLAEDFTLAWGPDMMLVAVTNWAAGSLNNGGDQIGLWSSFASYCEDHLTHNNVVAGVSYDDISPWPSDDGFGSIYLTDLSADGNDGSNWALSSIGVSTPAFDAYSSIALGGNGGSDIGSPGPGFPIMAEIYEIQGSGLSSPLVDKMVTTEDNVVTAIRSDGFVIQTPTARSDNDVNTSDGIFVFTGTAPTVVIGDQVDITGQIEEFFEFTQFAFGSSVSIDGPGTLPLPTIFDSMTPSPDPAIPSCSVNNFECFEAMYIEIIDGSVSGPNLRFGGDSIAEIHIVAGSDRALREPGVAYPGLGLPIPTWDGNPEVFELDVDKLGLMNEIIPAGSSFDARGVLGYEFGGYEFWPNELTTTPINLPVAVPERQVGNAIIGSLNLFRLFDDIDDPQSINFQGGARDDVVVSTVEYMRRRTKIVKYIMEVLRAPDILAVQEAEKLDVLQDLATDITAIDPSVVYSVHLMEGNDPGTIDIGFLVREDLVQINGITQLGLTETYFNPITLEDDILHDRPPLLLEGQFLYNGETTLPIAVLGVHNRSLAGIDGPEAVRIRTKRLEQAQSIAAKANLIQSTGVGLVVTGDFNAFQFTDGFVDVVGQISGDFVSMENQLSGDDLVHPNLINQTLSLDVKDRYSFIFQGNAQALDHTLTSTTLNSVIRDFRYGRGNADAAVTLIDDETSPLRSSDHDGQVLFLNVAPIDINTWVGSINSDWMEPNNWSTGFVPTCISPIVIPDVANSPIISAGQIGHAYNISIQSGGQLTIQNMGTMNIFSKNFTIDEDGLFTAQAGSQLII